MAAKKREPEPGEVTIAALMKKQGASDETVAVGVNLARLMSKAQQGDQAAMKELRAAVPSDEVFWDSVGDVARATVETQLRILYGEDLVFREGLKRRLAKMREELAGPGCAPLERLLADRIVICWLQLQYADAIYAQNMKDLNLHWNDLYQRRQDRAHRRFLSACKALATVRRLAIPALQVNIGEKQINVAQVETSPA